MNAAAVEVAESGWGVDDDDADRREAVLRALEHADAGSPIAAAAAPPHAERPHVAPGGTGDRSDGSPPDDDDSGLSARPAAGSDPGADVHPGILSLMMTMQHAEQ